MNPNRRQILGITALGITTGAVATFAAINAASAQHIHRWIYEGGNKCWCGAHRNVSHSYDARREHDYRARTVSRGPKKITPVYP